MGVSDDHRYFLMGSLRSATYARTSGLKFQELKISRLPGWPEYFAGFTFLKDGTAFGVTSASRIIQISKSGSVMKTEPVY